MVQRVGAQKINGNCGGLSQKVQDALTAKYARKKLSTGVVGFDDICQIYCACKFYGPSSFPWFGTSLCGNLSPLPQRRLRSLPFPRRSRLFDEAEQNVGGGKIYGEYNKGPVKVGGEWEFDEAEQNVGGGKIYGEYNKGPVKVGGEWDFDESEQNVGGGKIYGEYNKGPVKVGGEWNFDEEDQSVGQPNFRRLMSQGLPPPGTFKRCGQMIAFVQSKMPVGASPQCSATLLGGCCKECTYDQSTAQCQACGKNALLKNMMKVRQMKCLMPLPIALMKPSKTLAVERSTVNTTKVL